MSEESDRVSADEATPNRGRRREPPTIDAQANEAPPPKAARARGAGLALVASLLALAGAGASLWLTFNARETSSASEAAAALAQRLDRLERRVGAVENKPAPVIPDTAPLAARIASIDTKADRIAAEATRAAQMAEEALRKPPAPAPSDAKIDLSPLEQRIAALEQRAMPQIDEARLSKIEHDLASVRRNTDSAERNRGPAMAIVATSLQQKLDRGESFSREMAALEKLDADSNLLSKLKPLAASGLTPPQKLAQDFSNRASALLRAAQPAPENEDLLERIVRSAASLIRIRPAGDTTQDHAPALISRIEAALQRHDVATAVTLFEKLPATAQDQARDWAQLAKARAQADTAARMLVAQAIEMIAGK